MRAVCLAVVSSIACSVAYAQGGAAPEPAAVQPAPASTASDPLVAAAIAGQRDALGRECELKETFAADSLRYLACGSAGLWIVRVAPGLPASTLERREVEGEVLGFFVQDGYLWMRIASVQARRLARAEGAALAPAAPAPPTAAPAPAATAPAPAAAAPPATPTAPPAGHALFPGRQAHDANVIEVGSDHVVIDAGSVDEVRDGQHIAFYKSIREQVANGIATERMELIAIGNVDGVASSRSRVVLGLNECVPLGTVARPTTKPLSAGTLAPPRASEVWEIGFLARPFLVLENLGTGVFADLRAGYRPDYDMHFEVLVMPIAFATAEQGLTVPAAAVFAASYDTRLFEVGLGIGGQTINDPAFDLEPGSGITALQRVRIGARDGLYIEALSYVALFHSEFEFSSLRVQGQIPLSHGSWLLASGGGGSLGLGYGEIGLRVLLSGNGNRDSFFLTTTIGGVHVFESSNCFDPFATCETEIDYVGPMVGVGGEWRL